MSNYNYNPTPPRVWSRVQNQCTYIIPGDMYQEAYIPLTGQTVPLAQANYETQMLYKGNILQYKGNSARLTKSQKYSQLARCAGPNRTKVFATQSQTYTNPNTTGLLRVGYSTYPFPNQIVGAPNNISGPFAYGMANPNDCSNNSIQEGGTLVCGTYANPCTGEIYQASSTDPNICNPASASNVPGPSVLCWNKSIQSWFPRYRYNMNNSGTKWPYNYKGLISAVTPLPPVLTLESNTNTSVTLSWVYNYGTVNCIPISSFNIYQNGTIIQTQPYQITSTTIYGLSLCTNYSFYVTAVSNGVESAPSNVVYNTLSLYDASGYSTIFTTENYTGVVFEYSTNPQSITFCFNLNNVNVLAVAGGGGGGQTLYDGNPGGGGGGGGGIYYSSSFNVTAGQYDIVVGYGGNGTAIFPQYQQGGSSQISFNSIPIITVTGGGGSVQSANSYGGAAGGPGVGPGYYTGGSGANGKYFNSSPIPAFPPGSNSGLTSIVIPTQPPITLNLSGGAGGAINTSSTSTGSTGIMMEPAGPCGSAGNGTGGATGGNPGPNGQSGANSFTNGGGFGGGGGGTAGYGNPNANSGNGGAGVVIFWWQNA